VGQSIVEEVGTYINIVTIMNTERTESKDCSTDRLSILYIFRNSLKLSSVSFLSYAIVFFVNIAIAKLLGPERFGMAGFVLLFLQYAGVVRLGFIYAGYREWIAERNKGNEAYAIKIQNVAITDELLFAFIPIVFLFTAGILFSETFYRFGFWLSSLLLLSLTIDRIFGSVHLSFERFNLSSRNRFLVSAVGPILSLILIAYVGLYALLLSPIIVTIGSIVLWLFFSPAIHYTPVLDFKCTRQLLLIGLPMSLVGFAFTIFRVADRTVVALLLTPAELGYFNFASAIILAFAMLVNDFNTVITPVMWSEVSRHGFSETTVSNIKKVTLQTVMAAGFILNLMQAVLSFMLIRFVPNYVNSFPLLDILVFNLVPFQLLVVPEIILQSQNVQRQWVVLKLYVLGIVLVLGSGYVLITFGYGIYGLVYASVISQLIISIVGNYFIDRYLCRSSSERVYYYGRLAVLMLITVLVYLLLQIGPFAANYERIDISSLAWRITLVVVVWSFVALTDKFLLNNYRFRMKNAEV